MAILALLCQGKRLGESFIKTPLHLTNQQVLPGFGVSYVPGDLAGFYADFNNLMHNTDVEGQIIRVHNL